MKGPRSGFTLIELLVVLAIAGVLVALLGPVVQGARESARRTQCKKNVMQLVLALENYATAFETLPPGVVAETGPIRHEEQGYHVGWIAQILPYIDERNAFSRCDFSVGAYDPANHPIRCDELPVLRCPSDSGPVDGVVPSHYAGSHHDVEAPIDADNRGVLFLNSSVRNEEIAGGHAHTIFLGEKRLDPDDLGWISGTRATLRNTGTPINGGGTHPPGAAPAGPGPLEVGGFGSVHPRGAHFGFGDGSVRFLNEKIAEDVYQQLGRRGDVSLSGW